MTSQDTSWLVGGVIFFLTLAVIFFVSDKGEKRLDKIGSNVSNIMQGIDKNVNE
jgi:hypothetical protein